MRLTDVYTMAFKALKDRKLRSALTILGIIIGSALIVALIASTSGLTKNVTQQMEKIGVTTISVFSISQRTPITDEDVRAVREIVGVSEVIPYISRRLNLNYGSNTLSVSVYGIDQTKLPLLFKGLTLMEGEFIDEYDPVGVVVGSAIANPPSGSFPSIGLNEMLVLQESSFGGKVSSYSFLVKGILTPYGAAGFVNLDEAVFMSLTGARLIFSSQYYSGLYVICESTGKVNSVIEALQNYFGSNARVASSSALLSTVESITTQLTLFLGSIAVVSLFVAGIGITNTMYISVVERTREIGILKAIGYKPKQILSLFLAEATITGFIGSLFGTLVGIALAYMLGGHLPFGGVRVPGMGGGFGGRGVSPVSFGSVSFTPVFSVNLIIFSLGFPIAIAVLAGFYPAWRASKVNTVTALKYE